MRRGGNPPPRTSPKVPSPKNAKSSRVSEFQKFRREKLRQMKEEKESKKTDSDSDTINASLIREARTKGVLNLSNKSLENVPECVWKINDPDRTDVKKTSLAMDKLEENNWWDEVDLTKLILASNKISGLSKAVCNLLSLQTLDIHDNRLENIPAEVGLLDNLVKLNFNHNKITSLPGELSNLKKLKSFSIAHNNLTEMKDELMSKWDSLESLDLSHNGLKYCSHDIGYLVDLTSLNLSHNKLAKIPSEINFLRKLQVAELSHNELKSVRDVFSGCSSLERLYLQNNRIEEFPSLNLKLKELHLGYNKIKIIPEENFEKIKSIIYLDIKMNSIEILPDTIVKLQKLERLDVSNNKLTNLPSGLGLLPNVVSLLVGGNPIKTIRRDILNRGAVGLLKYLKSRLDDKDVEELRKDGGLSPDLMPEDIPSHLPDKYMMRAARCMRLSGLELTSVPDEAVNNAIEAREVNAVDLSKNNLTEFPDNLGSLLSSISEINLSNNKLNFVAEIMTKNGKDLQFVNLANNRLSSFDYAGSYLREINLCHNKFSEIPPSLFDCLTLEIILMSGNKITVIDVEGLSKLKRLATLDLSYNDIPSVPPELGNLKQILHLLIEGNSFRVPRAEVLSKGTEAIMSYLRGRIVQ